MGLFLYLVLDVVKRVGNTHINALHRSLSCYGTFIHNPALVVRIGFLFTGNGSKGVTKRNIHFVTSEKVHFSQRRHLTNTRNVSVGVCTLGFELLPLYIVS